MKEQLRQAYYKETGEKWVNSQGRPDIDYVNWLEDLVLLIGLKYILTQSKALDSYESGCVDHKPTS